MHPNIDMFKLLQYEKTILLNLRAIASECEWILRIKCDIIIKYTRKSTHKGQQIHALRIQESILIGGQHFRLLSCETVETCA